MCTLIIGCLWALAACEPDVVRPGLQPPDEPVLAQMSEPVDVQVAPAGDTYVSRTLPAQNFGADTLLLLDGDHRPLLRWDSAAVAEAIGNGSLLEARLELTVLTNSGGWPGNARWVALHTMSEEWVEEEASWNCSSADPAPCDPWSMDEPEELEGPQGPYHSPWNPQATDSLRVMNNTDGVVTFDVTADVVAALQGGVYRHGWLLKRVNESTGGALEIGAREGGSEPRLVLTVELPEQVPDVPPDTIPAWLYDLEVSDSPVISGTFLKNILFVIFEEGASQAEKQEAIEAVGGTVVGGRPRFGERGIYVVLIEDLHPEVPGKGLLEAMELLQDLPQIDLARPEFVFQRMHQHLKPNDGAGWGTADWAVDPADAAAGSARWGLERMATPLAWGCSVGDDSTRIAVVDQGFHAVSDLTPNVAFSLGMGVLPDTLDHGVRMASALGARGNNQDGMTGVMWRAALHLYEVSVDSAGSVTLGPSGQPTIRLDQMLDRIEQAARAGIGVTNLSLGLDPANFTAPGPAAPSSDSVVVLSVRNALHRDMARLSSDGFNPLLVISAGNGDHAGQGIDAFWDGLAPVRDSFPDRVLVVAASELVQGQDQLTVFSNRNAQTNLVEVAAPGDSVGTLDRWGSLDPSSGTSQAAALVSGIAGLLLSFDPSLTAPELKDLIIAGAVAGGRTAGGIPVANAYESLKAAARRDGAPLCGSRIAADEHILMVERDSGWESLLTLDGSRGRLNPHHGGRTMDAYVQNTDTQVDHQDRFTLQGGAWQHDGPAPDLPDFGGLPAGLPEGSIYNSTLGVSHDGDTTAIIGLQDGEFRVRIIQTGNAAAVYHDHFLDEPFFNPTPGGGCAVKTEFEGSESCVETVGWSDWEQSWPHGSWVPMGGRVLVAVRRFEMSGSFGEWYACGEWECRDREIQRVWFETDFSEMDVTTGDRRPLFSIPYFAEQVAVSEDGREIMVARVRDEHDHDSLWWTMGINEFGHERPLAEWSWLREKTECAVEWRDYETGQLLASSPFERPCFSEGSQWSGVTQSGSSSETFTWFLGSLSP